MEEYREEGMNEEKEGVRQKMRKEREMEGSWERSRERLREEEAEGMEGGRFGRCRFREEEGR